MVQAPDLRGTGRAAALRLLGGGAREFHDFRVMLDVGRHEPGELVGRHRDDEASLGNDELLERFVLRARDHGPIQLFDPGARHTLTGLLALADAPPPAAMALFKAPAPISTMTWSIEVLDAPTPGDDGWRLIRSEAEQIEGGYSSQSMSIWDEAGAPLLVSRQCVAVFA